jgi:hypothetical protein
MFKLNPVVFVSVAAGSICLFGSPVKAAVIINAVESNGNVVFNYNGTIDTAGLTDAGLGGAGSAWINPSNGEFLAVPGSFPQQQYTGVITFQSFGAGSWTDTNSSVSGNHFGVTIGLNDNVLWVPNGYTGGSSISGSLTFASTDFATLGLTPGASSTISLPNDTITMNIAAVPAPLPLRGLGAATAFSRKLKQRIALRRKQDEVGAAV